MISAFVRHLGRFRRNRKGNIATTFALAALPVLAAVGCAIDYSRVIQIRTKLQSAIDAASVGAVARLSPASVAATTMTSDGPIPAGVVDAKNIFNGNIAGQAGFTLKDLTAVVAKDGNKLSSTVGFSAEVATMFLSVINIKTVMVTGTSSAVAGGGVTFIDFYLLLDNSPSMGLAATTADQTKLIQKTAGQASDPNCAFACHITARPLPGGQTYDNYEIARQNGVTLRIDSVRQATQKLIDTAKTTEGSSSLYRMAIYDYGASASSIGLRKLFALSSDLSSAKTAAGAIDLMTSAWWGTNNDQDTPNSTILPAIASEISVPGDGGTAATPQKYLFIVSDGVTDEACASSVIAPGTSYPKDGPRCIMPLNPALCDPIKARGIKIATMYTTYLDLPGDGYYQMYVKPYNAGPYIPSLNSQIAKNMQACASPGMYLEIGPDSNIADAMTQLFKQSVAVAARISQ